MSYEEPSSIEVLINLAVGKRFGPIYRDYIEGLNLRGDERVLDFGSGAGTPALYLAHKLSPRGHLTCVDISRVWLDTARKRLGKYRNVDFCLGDIRTLNLPETSYDVLFLHFVLHDIPAGDRPGIVKEHGRVLAAGGRVFLREPLRFISEDEIRALMQAHGLVEIESRTASVPTQGQAYEGVWQN